MIRPAALVVLLALAAQPARADDPVRTMVYDLIAQRLALMEPVAAWKQANGVAVEDLAREAKVLDAATADAAEAGIRAETVRPFFQAQIDAAKAIQTCWLERWARGSAPPPADPPDLQAEIRPRLLSIGTALIQSIRDALTEGVDFDPDHAGEFAKAVDIDCLDARARDAINAALTEIRLVR